MRIGELAREAGTTPRTVRYYEEIGLLPRPTRASAGAHREYGVGDLERLREILRLKDLLGLSLDELREVDARRGRACAERRRAWRETLGSGASGGGSWPRRRRTSTGCWSSWRAGGASWRRWSASCSNGASAPSAAETA